MIFIPKPGKPSHKNPKALEKLCVWDIDDTIKHSPLHKFQHGFRTDRSTETAISSVVDYIEKHIFFGRHVLSVFLDIAAAFDTIDPLHIRDTMQRKGIKDAITDWYYKYITHRNVEININDVTVKKTIKTGFHKGGYAAPNSG